MSNDEKVWETLNKARELLVVLGGLRTAMEGGTVNSMSDGELREFVEVVRQRFGLKEFGEEQLEKLVCSLRNASPGQIDNLSKHLQLFRNIQNFLKKKLN